MLLYKDRLKTFARGLVDTGFTDELCLPSEAVALLNLPFRYDMRANLADNSQVMLPLHKAIIAFPVRTRYIIDVKKLNQQRSKGATQV